MWKEFKAFAFKGNVMDMAVGVMIGAAFGKIVTSVVNDLFMPLISLLIGGIHFEDWFVALNGKTYPTLAAAQADGAACLAYGSFLTAVMDFFLIALCIFFFLKAITKAKHITGLKAEAEEKKPRLCPYCRQAIADDATRCPHCTSILNGEGSQA